MLIDMKHFLCDIFYSHVVHPYDEEQRVSNWLTETESTVLG